MYEKVLEELGEVLRKQSCVLFCGAGISVPSGLPTAKKFLSECNYNELNWLAALDTLKATNPNFERTFKRRFGSKKLKPNKNHYYLALLNVKYYITTNYDILLEKAFQEIYGSEYRSKVKVIHEEKDLPGLDLYQNIIIKLHGDVNNDNLLVLTGADYRARWRHPTLVDTFAAHLFATNTILFVGYDLWDEHIVDIVEYKKRLVVPELPEGYIVIPKLCDERSRYITSLGLTPIDLGCQSDREGEITQKYYDFLHRVWEQLEDYSDFTRMLENNKFNTRELLLRAMASRQEGKLEEAKRIHEILLDRNINWAHHINLLPRFIWLTIGVLDKLEEWETLKTLDANTFKGLFRILGQSSIPDEVCETLRGTYEGDMAMALLRAGELEDALTRIESVLGSEPTDTAPTNVQILFANILTVTAVIKISLKVYDRAPIELSEVEEHLKRAKSLYDKYGMEGETNESHHMGRFYGTRAFFHLIKLESEPKETWEWKKLLRDAERSHNGKNRTRFGKVAGLYCDALCNFEIGTQFEDNKEQKIALLKKALGLLKKAEALTNENQLMANAKISSLRVAVMKALNLITKDYKKEDYKKECRETMNKMKNRKQYKEISIDCPDDTCPDNDCCLQWKRIPLN